MGPMLKDRYHYHDMRKLAKNSYSRKETPLAELKPDEDSIDIAAGLQYYDWDNPRPKDLIPVSEKDKQRLFSVATRDNIFNCKLVLQKFFRSPFSLIQLLSEEIENIPTENVEMLFTWLVSTAWPCLYDLRSENSSLYLKLLQNFLDRFEEVFLGPLVGATKDWLQDPSKPHIVDSKVYHHILKVSPESIVWENENTLHNYNRKNTPVLNLFGYPADEWQEKVIHLAKEGKSCLVCAPTTAGKTFVSRELMRMYANDGLVVYLCPTIALATMVFTDITQSVHKIVNGKKEPVSGLFTSKLRVRENNCNILVIIPEILQLLLLGSEGSHIRSKLKCVVVDEVHYLNDTDRGPVLESFFSMLQCPMFAFSATLNGAGSFVEWFNYLHKDEQALKTIPEDLMNDAINRSTDLQCHIYTGLTKLGSAITSFHPFVLSENSYDFLNYVDSLPGILPTQLLETLEAMSNELRLELLSRTGVHEEVSTTELLAHLFEELGGVSFPPMRRDVQRVDLLIRKKLKSLNNRALIDGFLKNISEKYNSAFLEEKPQIRHDDLMYVFSHLKENNMLPAMIFFFGINRIMYVARGWAEQLIAKKAPKLWETNPEVYQELKKEYTTLTQTECPAGLSADSFDLIKMCLPYGIGIHHARLPIEIRRLMEKLFARCQLQVIICTSTLATGVHTPCKTVVVADDHHFFFQGMDYHQISGRAGRR